MEPRKSRSAQHGFTLLEILAGLVIASVIIVTTTTLIRNVVFHFDRGVRSVNVAERLTLAVQRLAADFSSARFVLRATETGAAFAFIGEPAKIVFVAAGGIASGPQGEELVALSVETVGAGTRLVRRRAAWPGPGTRFEDLTLRDSVDMIEGDFDIAFAFGRAAPNGSLVWSDSWDGQGSLPRFVRLILRDRATGTEPLPRAVFVIRADAPRACAEPDAIPTCLIIVPGGPAPSAQPEIRRARG